MQPSRAFLLCAALYVVGVTAQSRGDSSDGCGEYNALYPTIYEQLAPFFGGITQKQIDWASTHMPLYDEPGQVPKKAKTKFNATAAQTLPPESPDFPWSNAFFVKVVSLDGVLYLPGGPIPQNRQGFAFSISGYNSFLLTDLLDVNDKYGPFPDFEFFVTAGDFQRAKDLNEDNTTFPVFGATGSKRFYDLVLPESHTTQYYRPPDNTSMDWADRNEVVVGRYNNMCHRGGASLQWRGTAEKHPCVRHAYHDIANGELNHDGILDVGIYQFVDNPKPVAAPEYLEQAKYRLVLDGATTANRLPHLLTKGQLLLLEDHSPMFSHFYAALTPWVHYVPVGRDSYKDIFDVARFLVRNDDLARKIAKQGRDFGIKYLHPKASECYSRLMLEELSSLYTYRPRPLGSKAITLRHALELVESDRIWMNNDAEY